MLRDMDRPGALLWCTRVAAIGAAGVLAGALGVPDALAKTTKHPKSTPSFYTLKNAKQKCRAHYTKQTITITVRRGRRRVRHHQLRCIYTGNTAGGKPVSFPTDLPTAAITVTVIPSAGDRSFAIAAGETLNIAGAGVLTGSDGSGLTAVLVSATAHGTLTFANSGRFVYVPASGFSGIDSFKYRTVSSTGESSSPATVTIHVTPVAVAVGAYALPPTGELSVSAPGVLTADTGSGLSARLVSGPAAGSLTLNADGSFDYTAAPDFIGSAGFTFEAVDASGQASNAVTVTINVGVRAPAVVSQSFVGAIGNTALQVGGSRAAGPEVYDATTNALHGDSDPSGGTLSTKPATITTADGGTVTLAGDGTFTYEPPAGFTGPSDSFSYEVDSSEGASAAASATIAFDPARVWYADNASGAPAGAGTSAAPFNSLAQAVAAAAQGDIVFLFDSSTPYTGGLTLGPDQTLVGQPVGLTVYGEDLLDPSSGSSAQITSSGVGLTLSDGDLLEGVTIENTGGAGVSMGAGSFTIEKVAITDPHGDGIVASSAAWLTLTGSAIYGSVAGDAVHLVDGDGSTAFDTIDNNVIGISGTAGSGSASAYGIELRSSGASSMLTAWVSNNQVYDTARDGVLGVATAGGTLDLNLNANTVTTDSSSTGNGVTIDAGTGLGDVATVCANPTGNTVSAGGAGTHAIELDQPDASSEFGVENYSGLPGGVSAVHDFLVSTLPGGLANILTAPGGSAAAYVTQPNGYSGTATPAAGFVTCTVAQPLS
jgi:Bacterial Ig domain/Protein of unknown function (DUF1565)